MIPAAPPAIIPNEDVAWSIGRSLASARPETTLSASVATQTRSTRSPWDATSCSVDDCA
jgi:hypothetical protein